GTWRKRKVDAGLRRHTALLNLRGWGPLAGLWYRTVKATSTRILPINRVRSKCWCARARIGGLRTDHICLPRPGCCPRPGAWRSICRLLPAAAPAPPSYLCGSVRSKSRARSADMAIDLKKTDVVIVGLGAV